MPLLILFAEKNEVGTAARKAMLEVSPKFKGKALLAETDIEDE